jgi:hypothetical protein
MQCVSRKVIALKHHLNIVQAMFLLSGTEGVAICELFCHPPRKRVSKACICIYSVSQCITSPKQETDYACVNIGFPLISAVPENRLINSF